MNIFKKKTSPKGPIFFLSNYFSFNLFSLFFFFWGVFGSQEVVAKRNEVKKNRNLGFLGQEISKLSRQDIDKLLLNFLV